MVHVFLFEYVKGYSYNKNIIIIIIIINIIIITDCSWVVTRWQ